MASKFTTNWIRRITHRVAWLCLLLPLTGSLAAEKPTLTEPQIKALFLFNFVRYVEWPATAFGETNAPIVIGLVGAAGLEGDLKVITHDQTVNGRKVAVRVVNDEASQRKCHLLFVPAEEKRQWAEIKRGLEGAPVLTVSDLDRFLAVGGAVNLIRRDNKIRMEISEPAATRAGLKLSSRLFGVADRVERNPAEDR